ncbi:hypothetical protein HK100_011220 [Physocladia obscura]|uniref:Uncharacterized protein n=1 Tax=Physocladia obscura TaxID=109957 RepID=A0AAD5XM65_9FUNG|nr:hypothetical protein HK100_011220 [Physocladia obscura]
MQNQQFFPQNQQLLISTPLINIRRPINPLNRSITNPLVTQQSTSPAPSNTLVSTPLVLPPMQPSMQTAATSSLTPSVQASTAFSLVNAKTDDDVVDLTEFDDEIDEFIIPEKPKPKTIKRKGPDYKFVDNQRIIAPRLNESSNASRRSRELKSQILSVAGSNSSTIDLEDPAAMAKLEQEKERRTATHQNYLKRLMEPVCFGTIHINVVDVVPSAFARCNTNHSDLPIPVKLGKEFETGTVRAGNPLPTDNFKLTVVGTSSDLSSTPAQCLIGYIEERVTNLLKRFLVQLRMDAQIPSNVVLNNNSLPIQLTLIGPRGIGTQLGSLMLHNNLFLNLPIRKLPIPYENPHEAMLNGLANGSTSIRTSSGVTTVQIGGTNSTGNEAKTQIEAVYNALTAAEDLPQLEPDASMITSMYPHQKQALYFMTEKEKEVDYTKYDPKTSMWRFSGHDGMGGILADDMGLGKTIEVISLIMTSRTQVPELAVPAYKKFRLFGNKRSSAAATSAAATPEQNTSSAPSPNLSEIQQLPPSETIVISDNEDDDDVIAIEDDDNNLIKSKGTLIVCPLSTVQNWEEQFSLHVQPNTVKISIYHGPNRIQDPKELAKYDIVITTYNLLSIEFGRDMKSGGSSVAKSKKTSFASEAVQTPITVNSTLQLINWNRIVLDEAHIIKDPNTAQSKAACSLTGERSLIKFLRIQPFCNKASWNNYISKPVKFSQNSIGVDRLQTLMKSITLRRTKHQKINGNPILTLPERRDAIKLVQLAPKELELYTKVHGKGKAFFAQLKDSGSVMKHYVHLLEIILRMRQVCVHKSLFKDWEAELKAIDEQIESMADEVFPPLTLKRAQHLLSLLRESGDESCCGCGISVDTFGNGSSHDHNHHGESKATEKLSSGGGGGGTNEIKSLAVSNCGHLFCVPCMNSLREAGRVGESSSLSSPLCPMCNFSIGSNDIFEVKESDMMEDDSLLSELADLMDMDGQSTKIRALIEDLVVVRQENLQRQEQPSKSIVFSQWTNVLDLLQKPLRDAGFKYTRLDGKMTRFDRNNSMQNFKTDPEITILLISLKAGGVGLNLTAANRVYIMEPYWNPAVEAQAIDRVHRMGQTRVVNTVRFIAKGTIEENILELQRRKTKLAEMAFKDRGGGGGEGGVVDDAVGSKGKRRETTAATARDNKAEIARQRMLDLNLLFA